MRVSNAAGPAKSYYLIFTLIFIGKSFICILLKNTGTFVTLGCHANSLVTDTFDSTLSKRSKGFI